MATRWRGGNPAQHALTSLIEALVRETRSSTPAGRGDRAISHDLVMLQWALTSPRDDIEQGLLRAVNPDEPAPDHGLGLTPAVATASPKPGRNEPCPCGSGKKYKKCHGADEDGRAMIRIPLSASDVRAMMFRDLAGLDLAVLPDDALGAAFERFLERPAWPLVIDVMDQLASRPTISRGLMDERRSMVIQTAVAARRYDIAQRERARLGSDHRLDPVARAALALQARAVDALDQLWSAADVAVRDESFNRDFELAMILTHLIPALGLLVARGCHIDDEWAAEVLANRADEARAQLGLPPGDRLRDVQAALRREKSHGAALEVAHAKAADLHAALELSLEQNRQLERKILELQAQHRDQPPPQAEPAPPADPLEVRSLRAKVEDLQEMIRERNASLALLRRKLEEVTGAVTPSERPPRGPSKRR
jgi:hypothetical protein